MITALQHKEPDIVPLDLGATDSSGIMGVAYNKLKERLGISSKTQVFDVMQMIAKVEPSVINVIGVDAVPLLIEPKRWKSWILSDGTEVEIPQKANLQRLADGGIVHLGEDGTVLTRCPAGGLYFEPVCHPFANIKSIKEIEAGKKIFESVDWPAHLDEDFDDLREKAKKLYHQTDHAIVGNLCIHLFAAGQGLRGFEQFLIDIMLDKGLVHCLMDNLVEAYIPRIDKYIEAVGPYIQVILVNDDLGTQTGLQLAPSLYREMIKPYHRKLWQYIKRKSGKPLLLHSCGSIYELIPDLIEMGIDAINPVQVSALNMDTKRLKKEFGKDITFWGGGCDTQNVLCRGTVEDVKEEVRRRMDDLAPGGGFVFCQVHNILADVPVENILAMYAEFRDCCGVEKK